MHLLAGRALRTHVAILCCRVASVTRWSRYVTAAVRAGEMAEMMRVMMAAVLGLACLTATAQAADPDVIFRKSTVFKLLSPDDKLATYGVDDPDVEGVACHFTVPEKGGWSGALGLAEEVSDISLACRQVGPIRFKTKLEQGEVMFRQSRSLFFKRMQIVRGCDVRRNVLIYMVYSDKLIEGSPKNSTSTVPIMPWGNSDVPRCGEFLRS
jgi:CreA protein